MRHPIKVALASGLIALIALGRPDPVQAGDVGILIDQIQDALNSSKDSDFSSFFGVNLAPDMQKRHQRLLKRFPDARWTLNLANPLKDGRSTVEILVKGTKNSSGEIYNLVAKQRLAFRLKDEKITSQELIAQEAILKTSNQFIPITLQIPNAVLTGSRYDVDVVLENPLEDAMVAGGLVYMTKEQYLNNKRPDIVLSPMYGGGLFKSVQAPLEPGEQTWAILLVHPDGIISISKMVRIVDDESELSLSF